MSNIGSKLKWFFSSKLRILLTFILVIVIIMGSCFMFYNSKLQPVSNKKDDTIYFAIVENDNVTSISNRLEEQGIIDDAQMLRFYAKFNGISEFHIGRYQLNKSWSARHIIKYLSDKKNIVNDQVLITFREGIWAKDIAKLVEENTNVKAKDLIDLWNNEDFLKTLIEKYNFLDDSILNSEYPVKLEGYLFPETYYFKKETTPEAVTYVFLDHFNQEFESIKEDIAKSGYSIHELITLASVVQYESSSVEDMKMIAGVFENRLNIGMKLESSVTVCYALYEFDSWEQCESDYQIDSPYNTYKNEGLPIGPILNPGKDAIEATLYPTKSDYLYFLADVYGDGKVYYSKTFDEHLEKQKKYLSK